MAFENVRSNPGPMASINTTPLVDVMLVLLIIFMISAPLLTQKLSTPLSKLGETVVKPAEPRLIELRAAGEVVQYWIDGLPYDAASLTTLLRGTDQAVRIKTDPSLPYSAMVDMLALLQRAQIRKIGFDELYAK